MRAGLAVEVAHHAGHRRDAKLQRVGGVEQRLLVLLHVLAVGRAAGPSAWCSSATKRADDAAGLAAHQLGGIGVALLRHDRAAGGEGVRQRDEAERRRAPDHDLLGEPRQMDCRRARPRRGTRRRSRGPTRHRASWPSARRSPAPWRSCRGRSGCGVPASAAAPSGDSFRRARQSAKPAAVAPEHLDIGQQMMAEGDGLRRLQMREARHDGGGIFLGAVDQRGLQVAQHRLQPVDRVAHPQPEIERDLVVARARGMQPAAGRRRSAR